VQKKELGSREESAEEAGRIVPRKEEQTKEASMSRTLKCVALPDWIFYLPQPLVAIAVARCIHREFGPVNIFLAK
jgi:hypothetical protein